MIKAMGAIIILAAATCLGFMKGQQYEERIRDLKQLELIFQELLSDIRFGKITMAESFQRISLNVPIPFDRFLKNLCGEMKWKRGRRFEEIFSEEVKKCLEQSSLENSDLQKLKKVGHSMDGADRESQIHALEIYLREVKKEREWLEGMAPEQKKICRVLGVTGGVFLLIILL